jgi:hypothetical protein
VRPSHKSNWGESALERSEGWPLQGGRVKSVPNGWYPYRRAFACCISRSEQGNPP